jgi:uncharacterized membrane protein YoaK (UPF0700 family)
VFTAYVSANVDVVGVQTSAADALRIVPVVATVFGYVAVEASQLVPFALNIVPVPVAVDGNVAVVQDGADEAPD